MQLNFLFTVQEVNEESKELMRQALEEVKAYRFMQ